MILKIKMMKYLNYNQLHKHYKLHYKIQLDIKNMK